MKSRTVDRSRVYELQVLGDNKQGADLNEEANLAFFKL